MLPRAPEGQRPGRSRLLQPLAWYRWAPTDWLSSRRAVRLTWAEKGLARELIDLSWLKPIPADPQELAELLDVPREELDTLLPAVLGLFSVTPEGHLIYQPLESVRSEMDVMRLAQAVRRLGTVVNRGEPGITKANQGEGGEVNERSPEKDLNSRGSLEGKKEKKKNPPLEDQRKREKNPLGGKSKKPSVPLEFVHLKPPSIKWFSRLWESVQPQTKSRNGHEHVAFVRGDQAKAEHGFQTIVDCRLATPRELFLAFQLFQENGGIGGHVHLFLNPQTGAWMDYVRLVRAKPTPEPAMPAPCAL